MLRPISCFFVCLCFLLITGWARADITLVEEGQPRATIVISEAALQATPYVPKANDPGTPEAKVHLAALELQQYVRQISGAELAIVGDAQKPSGSLILIGASRLADAMNAKIPVGLTPKRRGDEGYVILARGETLLLAGNDDGPYHGSHYAVAELLNRLGVRWFMPSPFGEVVPEQKTIVVQDVEFRDAPDFPLRTWWSHMIPEMADQEAIWKLRNKMQLAANAVISVPGDSSIRAYLPDKELLDTQPDLFARNLNGTINPHMHNFSNPQAQQIAADKAIAIIEKHIAEHGRPPHSIGIAQDDGIPVDFSPGTMKLNQGFVNMVGREGVPQELSISEEWFHFINAMAEKMAAKHPDVIISTNGYANRDIPPEGMTLHPNLAILYAAIWADTLKPFTAANSWHGQVQGAMLKRWCELSDMVFIYNYNYTMLASLLAPSPTVSKLRVNLPLMKEWGVFGFFDETRQAYMEHGITTRYLRARMYWDADLDVDAALKNFFEKWYGPAAAPAERFWNALERRMQESPMIGHEDRIMPYVYTAELVTELEAAVAEARQLAKDPVHRQHVEVDAHIVENLKAYMALHDAEFAGDYAEAVAQADRIATEHKALNAINPFFVVVPGPGISPYATGTWAWQLPVRRQFYQSLHDRTTGKTGDLVVMAPREAAFTLDPADMGKPLRWYDPGFDRSQWQKLDVTKPFYIQGHVTDNGIPYRGLMWYVFDIDVPAAPQGRPVHVYAPVVLAEAWVWVNGQYIGHRPYLEAYTRPAPLEMDITHALKPGQRNTIAVRVTTGMNVSQAPDGFQGRLFLYSPKPVDEPTRP